MAHEKLTDRAELTTPAPADLVHIVDVSDATPTSKKITVNNLMKEAPVTQVNSKTGNVTLLTTDIGEGTNLYHTDARVDARIAAASVTQMSDVSSAGSGAIITTAERTTIQNNTTAISALATVASSGDYNDLNNKPSIPTKIGDLTDVQSAYGTAGQVLVVNQTANGLVYADQSGTGGGVTAVTGTAPIVVTGTTSPNVSVSLATTSTPGVMAAQDKTKLDGIDTGAEVNPTAAEIKTAYESNADTNAFTDGLLARLNSVELGAEVNPTASEIKTLYESNTNTNAFTDAAQTKLAAITSTGSGSIITAAERTQITTNQTNIAGLATVATTGSYNDLTNKPSFVAGISVTSPLTNTGTQTNPTLGIQAATTSLDGYLSATDKTKLNAITSTGSGAIITTAERTAIGTIPSTFNDLSNVNTTGQTAGSGIYYDGTQWEVGSPVNTLQNGTILNVNGSVALGSTILKGLFTNLTLVAGSVYVYDGTGSLVAADANNANGANMCVICADSTDGSKLCVNGIIKTATNTSSFKAMETVYMSETAGAITNIAPTTSGAIVRVLGYVIDPTRGTILFQPSNDWIVLE